MPTVERLFVFLTGDNRNRNPLKNLESLGKELCTGILYSLLEKNVLNLTEKEKDKFYDAELKDKVRVFADTMQQKGHQVEKVIVQTFLNKDNSISVKGKLEQFTMVLSNFPESMCFKSHPPPVPSIIPTFIYH